MYPQMKQPCSTRDVIKQDDARELLHTGRWQGSKEHLQTESGAKSDSPSMCAMVAPVLLNETSQGVQSPTFMSRPSGCMVAAVAVLVRVLVN
jgi:hypothetical protein